MDTLRADRLGCYGYGRATSPVVDRLAARGTLFTRCYAPSDYTQASTASLFTGQYPLAHGYVNSDYVLEDANPTMAEIFGDAGYTTAAFIANGLAGGKYRMDQGFHEHFEKNRASAFELAEAAREFIGRQSPAGDQPFLAYLHFLDVHDPHRIPPADFRRLADPATFAFDMQDSLLLETMVMRAWWSAVQKWRDEPGHQGEVARYFEDYSDLYDSSIAYWDEAVGSILEALAEHGLDRTTVVVVTSDHGEQLLEHGFFGHANSGYDGGPARPPRHLRPRRGRERPENLPPREPHRRAPHPSGAGGDSSAGTDPGAVPVALLKGRERPRPGGRPGHLFGGHLLRQPAGGHADPDPPRGEMEAHPRQAA